ncbi:MAG: hypothetical protein NVSMB13_20060 [Mycobacteriales bacterium]
MKQRPGGGVVDGADVGGECFEPGDEPGFCRGIGFGQTHEFHSYDNARDSRRRDRLSLASAMTEWPNGGMKFPKQDIRSPFDFEQMAKLVRPEDFEGRMLISADPDAHRAEIQKFLDLGVTRLYLHNVGRNQEQWIEVFGRDVLPKLTA